MVLVLAARYELPNPQQEPDDVFGRLLWLMRAPLTDDPWRAVGNAALLVLALYTLRRARQAWLVYRPGPIEVLRLTDATAGRETPVDDLTTQFRTALANIGLWAPSPLPGGSPAVDFLQLLKQSPEEKKSVMATIGTVLGIADVRSAIVVSGVVRARETELGLTVQVATLPTGGTVPVEVWGTTWDTVIERAASVVAATLLTRTRQCRRPPWATWCGLELDVDLFQHYQNAQRYVGARRYDEALGAYYEALDRDPTNLYIRLELAQLLETLGLYLDALVTYNDLVRLGARSDRRLLDWLTRKADPPDDAAVLSRGESLMSEPAADRTGGRSARPPRRLPQRSQQVALLLGRYRHALLLGFGEQLSRQWCERPRTQKPGERDRERERLRERLRGPFEFLYWDRYFFDLDEWGHRLSGDLEATLREPMDDMLRKSRTERSKAYFARMFSPWQWPEEEQDWRLWQQEFFHWAAAHELKYLVRDYQWWRGRRRPGMPISQTSLHIAHVWAPLRREWTRSLAERDRIWTVPGVAPFDDSEPRSLRLPWPPRPQEVDAALERLLRRRVPRWREWHDHYNAACTFAVTVLPDTIARPDPRRPVRSSTSVADEWQRAVERREEGLRRGAMRHLRRALDSMDSGFFRTKRDWIGGGDPDLMGLRATDDFRSLDGEYVPRTGPPPYRPLNALPLRLTHYMAKLAVVSARSRKEAWDRRGRPPYPSMGADVLEAWWTEEVQAWYLALSLARDHRHWQTRLRVLREVQAWAGRHGERLELAFPTYYDDPVIKYFDRRARALDHGRPARTDQHPHLSRAQPKDPWGQVEKRAQIAVRLRDARFAELASIITDLGIGCSPSRSGPARLRQIWTPPPEMTWAQFCQRWSSVWHAIETAFDNALRYEADPESPVFESEDGQWGTIAGYIDEAFATQSSSEKVLSRRVGLAAEALFQPLRQQLQPPSEPDVALPRKRHGLIAGPGVPRR